MPLLAIAFHALSGISTDIKSNIRTFLPRRELSSRLDWLFSNALSLHILISPSGCYLNPASIEEVHERSMVFLGPLRLDRQNIQEVLCYPTISSWLVSTTEGVYN